jgi:hypothetical protein
LQDNYRSFQGPVDIGLTTGRVLFEGFVLQIDLKLNFHFRQTQGLMHSIANLMGVDIMTPHYTTMSLRGNRLGLSAKTCIQERHRLRTRS